MKELEVGDDVFVSSLKKTGQITQVLGKNLLEVSIGNLRINCKKSDLRWIEKSSSGSRSRSREESNRVQQSGGKIGVDLHGKTSAQALEELEALLNRALLDDAERLEIVHGLGTGKLQRTVHNFLSNSRYIRQFHIDPANPGVTLAFL